MAFLTVNQFIRIALIICKPFDIPRDTFPMDQKMVRQNGWIPYNFESLSYELKVGISIISFALIFETRIRHC